ncbi:MAG: FKBP-type peptidyl-prolyl cis-trans isomerase [Sphingobacteriales bacterium]|jgi:FKBP-type peptidyl-prolyl cis-trans isomerase FkpA|nr:FKBP-type peptidyl-prolyl cis-trans isomerase [Sphingobacteriales bacterium]
MKKLGVLVLWIALLFTSCKKEEGCNYKDADVTATAAEIGTIQAYLTTNGLTAVQLPSGVFYTLNNPGSGATPQLCSRIRVNYDAYRLGTGTTFDSNQTADGIDFVLGLLIIGVQKAIPFVKPGGSITIYIPPSLGYGSEAIKDNNGIVILPANSFIKFDMALLSVQ